MDGLYEGQKRYYDLRAREYDASSWDVEGDEPREIAALVAALPLAHTLDVGCGTGFLSQYLRGEVTLLDASEAMLAIAAARVPGAKVVHGDALPLPFDDASFDRVFSSHFYGHLRPPERERFLAEARRVAGEVVLIEQNVTHYEGIERRRLADGSEHEVYKVYFDVETLLAELGDAELLHAGQFVVARS
ncbi:MAG TPA: class I SAM-dependent methyltransferase [Gaiellaceae bacterium]|nr:class I SAM-dependent methyltransferase [Gaiellaceae bacterium]